MPIGGYQVTSSEGNVASENSEGSNFQRTFKLQQKGKSKNISLVERPTATRIANPTNVRCEIRYGKDDSLF
jgi:hypothetical protein